MDEYEYVIEIQGMYDGWSIGVTYDGEYVNRWPKDDYRYEPIQKIIENYRKVDNANVHTNSNN